MDLRFNDEEQAFRQEVRSFIDAQLPAATREHLGAGLGPTKEMTVDWQRQLNARGWAVPHWALAWGGQPWSAIKRLIHDGGNRRRAFDGHAGGNGGKR